MASLRKTFCSSFIFGVLNNIKKWSFKHDFGRNYSLRFTVSLKCNSGLNHRLWKYSSLGKVIVRVFMTYKLFLLIWQTCDVYAHYSPLDYCPYICVFCTVRHGFVKMLVWTVILCVMFSVSVLSLCPLSLHLVSVALRLFYLCKDCACGTEKHTRPIM